MKPVHACERCGLREVRHELEQKGVIIRFCDECYWGEISDAGSAKPARKRIAAPAPSGREPK